MEHTLTNKGALGAMLCDAGEKADQWTPTYPHSDPGRLETYVRKAKLSCYKKRDNNFFPNLGVRQNFSHWTPKHTP